MFYTPIKALTVNYNSFLNKNPKKRKLTTRQFLLPLWQQISSLKLG
jgi:hypothetical protein